MNGTIRILVGGLLLVLGIALITMSEGTGIRIVVGGGGVGTGLVLMNSGRILRKKEKFSEEGDKENWRPPKDEG